MAITASMVKELREMTGAGMMECKKALTEADGDMDKAVDVLRTRGLAAVAKKAGRATNEGTVMALVSDDAKVGALVELNCETDFVGMNEKFKAYAEKIARAALAAKPTDLDGLKAAEFEGETVEAIVTDCIHVMGENTQQARFAVVEAGAVASYIHGGGKIGVLVTFDVDGIDAQRKISILASLAFGRHFFPQNVPTRGIRDVSVKDIALAARQGAAVRLIAWARRGDDGSVALAVEPMLIPRENQLAGVEDVFNAVLVKGDMLGDVVFYGKGAGKLPTASAVVADVIDALKNGVKIHDSLFWQESAPIEGLYGDSTPADHYVRLENATEAVAKDLFGQQIEMLDTSDGEAVFTLRGVTSGRLAELCAKARAAGVRVGNTLKWMAE